MKYLNPTLYEVIDEWSKELPHDYEVKKEGNTRDNLHNTQEQIVACLVEQFPMSYRQSYEVYCDLFKQREILSTYEALDTINVLALATGSGGDVFGLIHACERFFKGKKINIFSVEGNEDALQSQTNLFKRYVSANVIHNDVQLTPILTVLEVGLGRLKGALQQQCFKPYGIEKFDVIQGFKWMNERSIRGWFHCYDFYLFLNQHLFPNRIAVWLEEADLRSIHRSDHEIALRAVREYAMYCRRFQGKNQLTALTPTPCIARHLNGKSQECRGCLGCYYEVEACVKLAHQKSYRWQSQSVFVMKFVSGPLGQQLAKWLQDEEVGYQTSSIDDLPHLCTLDAKAEVKRQANAFVLGTLTREEG